MVLGMCKGKGFIAIWGEYFLINNIQENKGRTALTNAVLNEIQDIEGGNDLPNFDMTYKII